MKSQSLKFQQNCEGASLSRLTERDLEVGISNAGFVSEEDEANPDRGQDQQSTGHKDQRRDEPGGQGDGHEGELHEASANNNNFPKMKQTSSSSDHLAASTGAIPKRRPE